MRINDDFSKPAIVHAKQLEWQASPAVGVERRMLYRVGDEVARATSIVRYAPNSSFPRHTHHGGEEILVLEGTFQDEHGDYPAGSYFRNPPGSSHTPASQQGCTIFVRLWQFRQGDNKQVVYRPNEPQQEAITRLFSDDYENVRIEQWRANQDIKLNNTRGQELLVITGSLHFQDELLEEQSWIRLPAGHHFTAQAGEHGAKVWLKDAPLEHDDVIEIPTSG